MTDSLFSRASRRTTLQASIALVAGLGLATTALANDIPPPSGKSKLLRDKDVTVIIIDKDDDRSKSKRRKTDASKSTSSQRLPSIRIKRDEDVEIRIKRTDGGTIVRSGAKVIIVDKTSDGCKGDGVCIIRP